MNISYHTNTKRIRIELNIHHNHLISGMPSKRWYKQARCWVVPVLARNCQFILDNFSDKLDETTLKVCQESVARRKAINEPFPSWYEFGTKPMEHQAKALDFIWPLRGAMLDMEMGVGKTKIAIDFSAAKMQAQSAAITMVFCPVPIRRNWVNELATHIAPGFKYETFILDDMSSKANQKRFAKFMESDLPKYIIVGIESLSQGLGKGYTYKYALDAVAGKKYVALVDESHKAKNPDATRSQNIENLAQAAVATVMMTGTMTSKGILDLYMQYKIADPEILGFSDYYSYRNRYAEMGGYENREIVGYNNVEELMDLIRPYTYTATKAQVLDLPPKVYTKRYVTMTAEQQKAYREIDKRGETIVSDLKRQGKPVEVIVDHILSRYVLKQQICSGFMVVADPETGERNMITLVTPDKNPKITELISVMEDNPDKKFIVWARFRKEIADIAEVFTAVGVKFIEFHGGSSEEVRTSGDVMFNNGDYRVFLSSQQVGGTGLTLNSATVTYYYSNSFPYIDRAQSEDRNHRKGQDQSVLYIDAMVEHSVEEDIRAIHEQGRDVTEYIRTEIQKR